MIEENKEAHPEEEDTLIEVNLEEKDGNRIEREVTAEEDTTLNQETEEAQAEIKEDQDLIAKIIELTNYQTAENVTDLTLAKTAENIQDIKRRNALVLDVPPSIYTMMFAKNPNPMM